MKTYLLIISTMLFSLVSYAQVETEIQPDITTIGAISLDGENGAQGGLIDVKNQNGDNRVRIFGNPNPSDDVGFISMFNANNDRTVTVTAGLNSANQSSRIILYDSDGTQKITLNAGYDSSSKDSRIITDEIEIKGGSDLAELFDITDDSENVEAGMLVSLDPNEPGKLMLSQTAYDHKVAGIISGANGIKPGILMGQDETIAYGEDLVTLSGRTYVKANTSNGKITIGDLITTSDIVGEAMKATKKRKSKGAVIGKAMTALHDGSGFILVLVSLQ